MSVSVPAATLNIVLNGFFEDNSFVSGAEATAADAEIFNALSAAPEASVFPHLARWHKHITSKGDAINSLKAAEAPVAAAAAEEDDDIDLFGSDDEDVDEEAEKLKAQRLAEYKAKKEAKGPGPAAKSMITFEVKPWGEETDLDELEQMIKGIEMDGLVWAQKGQRIPVAFGIKKIQINATVEDAKVSTDDLSDLMMEFEDHVQSVDIAAFMKL
ncbi:Translation elongation factor 1 beta [Coemansia sp. RSA 2523]|nr:Translation elongation factor 1 beta [Coemansia sp. RSA 1591]KAJ1767617.1 Translation elongation factor 1 beta [Coemansia sp. RSA 1752]KAJ1776769.1 Translation elongation factor 1 beta [Coemansia sp. RSA 1824]KAJ1786273.1 Translation elongation factor 1 beta [Coemansia sp. RSA 2167]KAJ1794932.1 Translation elongation factor 1 beta [Coemansia sp. RSA 1938]KAJ1807003.1 Translation elongation factor 1 beta [Coemansia sp. RSA 2523]KAJ2135159.1 Translation elongation factor 1 beta [Coemansia sp